MAQDLNRSIKIYIDNSDALKSSQDLEKKIASLRSELQKLDAEGKREQKQYLNKEKSLRGLETQYSKYQNQVKETDRILRNLSGSTYNELLKTRRALRRELQNETKGTEAYTAKLKAYQAVQKQVTAAQHEMNGTLGAQASLFSRATNSFNKYWGIITAAMASITGLSLAFRKLSQDAAKMEDTYADVMKTTGMTREAVGDLNKEFKKMDTRTAREELNNLARDAGKLGLSSKKDILDFVEAGNQINVALGEDLGEGAIRNIGKMSEVFRNSTRELDQMDLKGRMLSIGSAINELGQSSTASEAYLVNFTQRLGGVASQADISIQNVLGFASALDQSGQAVEMSATAIQKFIMNLMGEPAKFARIAGLEVEAFSKLLKEDTNEAIKTVLRSLSEKGGFQQLIPIFKEMGLDGARAVGVLSALATNIDKVDEAQRIANNSFSEATSLTDEYNVKNENAAAELEKRRKAFKDAAEELGNRLNPALLKSTNYVTYLVKLMPGFLDFFMKYGKYILYLVSSFAVYNVATKASILWQTKLKEQLTLTNIQLRAQAMGAQIARVAMLSYNLVVALLTGNFTRMRAAWKLLTASMASNPIGLIAVAATAAVTGIIKLVKWLNRTSDATKAVENATKQFVAELGQEKREVNDLFTAYKNSNPETQTHLDLRKRIIDTYGKYLQGLVDENGNIADIAEAHRRVNNALREQIALKVRNSATDELMTASIDKQTKNVDKIMKKVAKQVASDTVRNAIQETINRTISDFEAAGGGDYMELQRQLLHEIQQVYGVDAYKGVNNIQQSVKSLIKDLKESNDSIDQVKAKYSGMISELTNTDSIIVNDEDDEVVTRFSDPAGDKNIYQEKLNALQEYINNEKNVLLQQLLDKEITQEAYNRQMEHLERERLQKTLEIYNMDQAKRIEVENLILENKIKALQTIEDFEREHQRKLKEMRDKAEQARLEQNDGTLRAIAEQNKNQWNEQRQKMNEQKAELAAIGFEFSNEMGAMLGGAVSGNEDLVASSLKNIINMGLDLLKVQVQMAIAGATAQSLAQPDAVATFGVAGFARAAILVGLIEAAFSAVKGVISSTMGNLGGSSSMSSSGSTTSTQRVVDQRARGKYDVIGAEDGRRYSVPYLGPATTGVVPTPALVGEYGPELIVSAPDFNRLQRHINYPLVLQAIQDSRVPQRAQGNYSALPSSTPQSTYSNLDNALLQELISLLSELKRNGVHASINYHEFERSQNRINNIRNQARR